MRDVAFHDQLAQERRGQNGGFYDFAEQFKSQLQRVFVISAVRMTHVVVEDLAKDFRAVEGVTDTFQRAGADESGGLADQESVILATAEIAHFRRAQHDAFFGLHHIAKK